MNQAQFFEDFEALPPNAQQELIDFAAFLRLRYEQPILKKPSSVKIDWDNNPFFGMWKDRDDMVDSSAWVRSLREKEWG